MKNFTKTLRIGTLPAADHQKWRGPVDVLIKVTFKDGNLSVTGPGGQTIMDYRDYDSRGHRDIADITPADGWDYATIRRLFDVWQQYHLNNMQAGTPAQTAFLRANPVPYCKDHYAATCAALANAGLLFVPHGDGIYTYGTQWLRIDVPDDVLNFLKSLPSAG